MSGRDEVLAKAKRLLAQVTELADDKAELDKVCRVQVEVIAELEAEIERLIARVAKAEAALEPTDEQGEK